MRRDFLVYCRHPEKPNKGRDESHVPTCELVDSPALGRAGQGKLVDYYIIMCVHYSVHFLSVIPACRESGAFGSFFQALSGELTNDGR